MLGTVLKLSSPPLARTDVRREYDALCCHRSGFWTYDPEGPSRQTTYPGQVAARTECHGIMLARLESDIGKHYLPSIATLKRYASALGHRLAAIRSRERSRGTNHSLTDRIIAATTVHALNREQLRFTRELLPRSIVGG